VKPRILRRGALLQKQINQEKNNVRETNSIADRDAGYKNR
jgi:hypothetical protein